MYFWIILATFFVAIMAKTMAPRDDYEEVTDVPRAEGVAINLSIQQNAALAYTYDNSGVAVVTYSDGCIGDGASGCPNQDISTYYPDGFQNPFDMRSEIYCFSNVDTKQRVDCNDPDSWHFVISYGNVPSQWRDPATGEVLYELRKALYKVIGDSVAVGIATQYAGESWAGTGALGSHFLIKTVKGLRHPIKEYNPDGTLKGFVDVGTAIPHGAMKEIAGCVPPFCGYAVEGPEVGQMVYVTRVGQAIGDMPAHIP